MAIVSQGTAVSILVGQCLQAVITAAPIAACMVEALPKHVRCTGLLIGYNVVQAAFGGTEAMIAITRSSARTEPHSGASAA